MKNLFKKNTLFYILITCQMLFYSCSQKKVEENKKDDPITKSDAKKSVIERFPNISFEEQVKLFLQENLNIDKNEKYTYEIVKGHLNNDGIQDAVISVNRYEFAKKRALNSKNPAKQFDLGLMGSDNLFYLFNGKEKKFSSSPTVIPSTPMVPLQLSLKKITSADKLDILIEYRIRNSAWIGIYEVSGFIPNLVFNWKKYDGFGSSNPEACLFTFSNINKGFPLKITISKAEITNNKSKEIKDYSTANAQIKSLNEIMYLFSFNKRINKYATKKESI